MKIQKHTLSIITINWNNANGLKKTIESVAAQLNEQVQYIVIDGDSEDGSKNIINQYKNIISVIVSTPNKGIYGNMNLGIQRALGDYCLFLNSGDWLNKNILPDILSECSGEDIIYFNTYLSYKNEIFIEQRYPPALTMNDFYKRTIGHQSTLIKTELFTKYGLYNEKNRIHSDYEFWLKTIIQGNCKTKHSNKFISFYDMGGRSSKPTKETGDEIAAILKRFLPQRVIDDYEYRHKREQEIAILMWYRKKKYLYAFLVIFFKIAKNASKISKSFKLIFGKIKKAIMIVTNQTFRINLL
jgi:glycosyltransferase involved in cell wall biosynthesis